VHCKNYVVGHLKIFIMGNCRVMNKICHFKQTHIGLPLTCVLIIKCTASTFINIFINGKTMQSNETEIL
jgi:hypothetical protein